MFGWGICGWGFFFFFFFFRWERVDVEGVRKIGDDEWVGVSFFPFHERICWWGGNSLIAVHAIDSYVLRLSAHFPSTACKLLTVSTMHSLSDLYVNPSTSFDLELSKPYVPSSGYPPGFSASPVGRLARSSGNASAMISAISLLQKCPATTKKR